MMTNEEIRNEVLKRAKIIETKREKKKKIIYSCLSVSLCLAIAVSVLLNRSIQNNILIEDETSNNKASKNESATILTKKNTAVSEQEKTGLTTENQTIKSNKIAVSLFTPTEKKSDYDAFGEDEYAHIDVVTDGSKRYRQLKKNQYAEYSLKTEFSQSDFGGLIGTVIEVNNINNKKIKICSQDPALKNSSAYYYKPTGNKAVIIVKNEKHCSAFVFEQFVDGGHGIDEIYSVFGVKSENDIESLTYTVSGMNGSDYQIIDRGTVKNRDKIKNFYDVTASLSPITGSSDWLDSAYEEYRNNSEKYKREDITAKIHLKNGLMISGIYYQPYIADGYVENMQSLSQEQNKTLREVFTAD